MNTENKALLDELKELKKEIKFMKRALLVFAFVIGGILAKVIEMTIG